MLVKTLSSEEVLSVHHVLAEDFAAAADPISPAGLKSHHLLESAVSRQHTGFNGRLKYESPQSNAASLAFGICCNHPFHNGNKRTALVTLLCHLDRNDLGFAQGVTHDEMYAFMLKVASHGFRVDSKSETRSDLEVEEMTRWIRKRTRRVEPGERVVTFRELRTILSTFGFVLEDLRNNSVDLVRYEERSSWFGLKKIQKRERIMRMSYPGDGHVVSKGTLRDIRSRAQLTTNDGIDSHMFYAKERPTDFFVHSYRGLLRRLARV